MTPDIGRFEHQAIRAATLATVPEFSDVRVTAVGEIVHRCPHVDEVDYGTATVTWTCQGSTLELHSLAAYLRSWAARPISHEEITATIRDDIAALPGVTDVEVSSDWNTARLAVHVGPVNP